MTRGIRGMSLTRAGADRHGVQAASRRVVEVARQARGAKVLPGRRHVHWAGHRPGGDRRGWVRARGSAVNGAVRQLGEAPGLTR